MSASDEDIRLLLRPGGRKRCYSFIFFLSLSILQDL